jgi:predicted DNA-binding protein YlxM (UPF0122 family)
MAEVNKGGRPIEFTEDVVNKLEQAFALDCTIEEACLYADISRQTYYNKIKERPELFDRFEELRQRPFLKARQTLVKNLDQPEHAKWYMERKKKKEFATRQEVENTGRIEVVNIEEREKIEQALDKLL